jgi:ABC-type uncharacterized transport system permease subunit
LNKSLDSSLNGLRKLFVSDSVIVPVVAIILGLITGAIVMLIGGYNPLVAYSSLFTSVFTKRQEFGETIREITPLILTGLSVAFAFRTGLFNIGTTGQFIMGSTAATIVGVKLSLPWFIHAPLAIIAGALLGGLWAALAGWLKAKRGVNEVISTIMLNWIALFLSNYVINRFLLEPGQAQSNKVQESASISLIGLSEFFDHARLHWGTLLALIGVFVFYVILWRTKQGFELRAVGHNMHAAEYAGINVKQNIVKAMFISGIFAGVAGACEILGVFHYQVLSSTLPAAGFDGIAVSLIGMNNPVGVLLGAILFGTLSYGSAGMSFSADVPPEIIRIVIGAVIFFVAAPGIVKWIIKPLYVKRKKEEVA